MRSYHLLPALALVHVVAAQPLVGPTHFANAEGNHMIADGIGATSPRSRHLQIHGINSSARMISSLSLRRDGRSGSAATFPSAIVVADIYVSTTATGTGTPSTTFDANHGADKVQVATFAPFQLPTSPPGPMPRPWDYKFPFNTPFPYGGSGAVCWDIVVQTRTNATPLLLDACANWTTNPCIEVYEGGTGCTATGGGGPLTLSGAGVPNWPMSSATLDYNGSNCPPNGPVSLMIGANAQMVGGVPLPFTLPGTATAPSGPCTLYTDSLVLLTVPANGAGQFAVQVTAAINAFHHGGSLYAQSVLLDANANSWGIVLSNLVQHHLVAPFNTVPVAHVYSNGTQGPTGTAISYQGLVTRFE